MDRIITARIRRETPVPPPKPPEVIGYRVLHMVEGGRVIPYTMPAVVPPIDTFALEMNEVIQRLAFDMLQLKNATTTPKTYRKIHGYAVAMNNEARNGYDGGIPHTDYINKKDLGASHPRYDKMQRMMQGSFLQGVESFSVVQMVRSALVLVRDLVTAPRLLARSFAPRVMGLVSNNILTCTPGLHGIDARNPCSALEAVRNHWYCNAVTVGPSHNPGAISHFPQGNGGEIVYPFLFDRPIRFPLEYLVKWQAPTHPDPTRVYL